MMVRYFRHFQSAGGDNEWVASGKYPQKYKCLLRLNRLMAKALWLVDDEHFTEIIENSGYQWSKTELALYIEIMAYAHQTATIALAMGLLPEEPLSHCDFLDISKIAKEIELYQNAYSR